MTSGRVEYRRNNSTCLSRLACIKQLVDINASLSARTHPEAYEIEAFYVYIPFFCGCTLRGNVHMLRYSQYRNVVEHQCLVEDLGAKNIGFQDVEVLSHLCAKVPGHGGKTYIVDDQEAMEDRLERVIEPRTVNHE
jgi:hypothetical protein